MDDLALISHQNFSRVFINVTFIVTETSPHFSTFVISQSFQSVSLSIEFLGCFFHVNVEVTQNHVLTRSYDRFTILRTKDVVGTKHQNFCFCTSFFAQWQMHRHLVTVEVRVKRSTYQRVQTDCTSFNQFWLKRLNTQTVQRRRTVQEYRVVIDNLFHDVPDT